MKRLQRGLGAFGTLVILVMAGVAGYYIYKSAIEPETVSVPSCKSQFNSCMANCRKTTTEAPQAQACQQACQRDVAACEARKR